MKFFEHQERARRRSRVLVLVFALAVGAVVAAVDGLVLALLALGRNELSPLLPGQIPGQIPGQTAVAPTGDLQILTWTSVLTLSFIAVAALIRAVRLGAGGSQVARELGGVEVGSDPADPLRRRLRNLVEEMALAAGVPVPEVFLLEREPGINAFAAGYTPADAAVAVTRGALEKLDRDQLQGVIAHELSHIVNGDTRIDIRLMGALFGILAISLIGRRLSMAGAHAGRAGSVVVVGWALRLIGALGLLAGRLVKAALARQREYLADASAVQFTRNPEGIAGALRRIAVEPSGSLLTVDTEEVSHMTFGEGTRTRLLSSHPPLDERIRRIDPRFHPAQLKALARRLALGQAGAGDARTTPGPTPAAEPPRLGAEPLNAPGLLDAIGDPGQAALLAAALVVESLPDGLLAAARSPEWAPALLCLLLLAPDQESRERETLIVARGLGAEAERRLAHLVAEHPTPAPRQRLPLAEIAFPALKRRPRADLARLDQTIEALIHADGQVEVFEYALARMLRVQIADALNPPQVRPTGPLELADLEAEARALILALARLGHADEPTTRAAEAAGLALAGWAPSRGPSLRETWREAFDHALTPLNALRPRAKGTLVAALVATAAHDHQVTVAEAEALRAICAVLHVPLPMPAPAPGQRP
jgi:Zn-dependent protease with chaperone function